MRMWIGTGAAALWLLAGQAMAQTANPPTLQKPDPEAAPSQSGKPPAPTLPTTGENLSRKLEASGGVIAPPGDVDPGITAPPKDPGAGSTMPVLPPPGSPGGDQSVRPK